MRLTSVTMTAVSLLSLADVTVRGSRHGRRAADVVLGHASLTLEAGELVTVWGVRRSGRTTLLQVAAGARAPAAGAVTFAGVDLALRPMLGVVDGIGYAFAQFSHAVADSVLAHVAAPLLRGRGSRVHAEARASDALRRVGAAACRNLDPAELDRTEAIRVAIARGIVTRPSLLLLDEPTYGAPPARSRDGLLELIGSLAHDDGIAVLMTTGEAADLAGADRALTLDGGKLRGDAPPRARVIFLRGSA